MTDFAPGDTIKDVFYHPTSGLSGSDFTVSVFKDSALTTKSVSIAEQSPGLYSVSFTTDTADATWAIDIVRNGTTVPRHQGTWTLKENESVSVASIGGGSAETLYKDLAYIRQMVERIKEFLVRRRG